MISRTACSTSGDTPRNRRLGILMVVPAFFNAMNFQNSASVARCTVRLSFRRSPFFFRPNAPVVS